MTMTDLSPRARAIITRHEVQDAERLNAARNRAARLRDLRNTEREILRRWRAFESRPTFEATNHENVKTANAHGRRRSSDEQKAAMAAAEQRELDHVQAEIARLDAESSPPVLTTAQITAELARLGPDLMEVDLPKVATAKGERSLRDALPRFRAVVADLKARRSEIEKAPLPADAAKKLARDQIRRLASRGAPRVGALFHGGEIGWPRLAPQTASGAYLNQPIDAATLDVFLHHDMLVKKLDELIDVNAAAFPNPLSSTERRDALAKIDAEIDAAERVEAACVEALVADGHRIFHRHDISVLAVLSYGVAL